MYGLLRDIKKKNRRMEICRGLNCFSCGPEYFFGIDQGCAGVFLDSMHGICYFYDGIISVSGMRYFQVDAYILSHECLPSGRICSIF